MLGTSNALGPNAALAFPFGALCATVYVDDHATLAVTVERRRRRFAQLLVVLASIHILFTLTAPGITRDAANLAADANASTRRRVQTAIIGLVVSILVLVTFARAVGA